MYLAGIIHVLALCRCKTSRYADISLYFKCFVTQQIHKDKCKRYPKFGVIIFKIYLLTIHNINSLEQYKNYSGELFGLTVIFKHSFSYF